MVKFWFVGLLCLAQAVLVWVLLLTCEFGSFIWINAIELFAG